MDGDGLSHLLAKIKAYIASALTGYISEPSSEGTNGQVLTTDGSGGRTWTTVSGGGSSTAALVTEAYTFPVSYSGGTVGTRGYQGSETITKSGYTPIAATITYVGASASYIPVAFLGGSGATLYCNAYRCTTSAVSNSNITVTVVYAKDGAGATTLAAWDGSME